MKGKTNAKLRTAAFLMAFTLLAACGSSEPKAEPMTQNQIDAKIDSLVGVKLAEISMQAMEDLDHRMAIEVKAKADSIVAARTGVEQEVKMPPPMDTSEIVF